jgi:hypothetical protein
LVCALEAPRQVSGVGVVGCVGEGLEIAGAVEQLVFQSEVTEQRAGDRLALLNDRFGQRCRAAQGGGDDVGHPAQITQRGSDHCARCCAFAAFVANSSRTASSRACACRVCAICASVLVSCWSVRSWVMSFWVVVSVIVLLIE